MTRDPDDLERLLERANLGRPISKRVFMELIERAKEVEREVESLKQFVPMSAIEAARAKNLEARLRAVEGKLALAEEVVEVVKGFTDRWGQLKDSKRFRDALRRYDEATKE